MPYSNMLPTLMADPRPQVGGLLTAAYGPYPQAGMSPAVSPQSGLLSNMGPWSQMAYQMAGSPKQGGPYASVASPPSPPGSTGTSSGTGSTAGGILGGLLGVAAKNPGLVKNAVSGISSLFGGGQAAGSIGSIMAGGSPALSAVGTGAVAPAVDAAAADASAALGGGAAAGSGAAAAGGLLGGGASGAGSIASGTAAASQTGGAAAGAAPGALGTAALVASPFIFQQAALALGDAWTKKNTQGNAAMKAWMNGTGATWKANYSNSGQNTFGTNNGLLNSSTSPGTMYDKSGKAMDPKAVSAAIYQWAVQNGINPGDFHA